VSKLLLSVTLENNLRQDSVIVALAVSEAEDLPKFGLRRSHLDEVFLEPLRYLLVAGVRLAYGGHLKAGGYTVRLADLLRDPVVEQLRGDQLAVAVPRMGCCPC
jgi:SLOG cluster2